MGVGIIWVVVGGSVYILGRGSRWVYFGWW